MFHVTNVDHILVVTNPHPSIWSFFQQQ
jgi:hypothetical protein